MGVTTMEMVTSIGVLLFCAALMVSRGVLVWMDVKVSQARRAREAEAVQEVHKALLELMVKRDQRAQMAKMGIPWSSRNCPLVRLVVRLEGQPC
jgi:hypothetical protein